jgi:hypothetical protein
MQQQVLIALLFVQYLVTAIVVIRLILRQRRGTPMIAQAVSASTSRFPPPEASATEVRQYFVQVLHEEFDIPLLQADALVAPWEYGRGAELDHYDAPAFRAIFGGEIGSILHLHSQKRRGNYLPKVFTGALGIAPAGKQSSPFEVPITLSHSLELIIYLFLALSLLCGLRSIFELNGAVIEGVGFWSKLSFLFCMAFLVTYTMYYLV